MHTGQSGEKFIGDVLAQTFFAKLATVDVEDLGFEGCIRFLCATALGGMGPIQSESCPCNVMNLAEVVIEARDFQPVTIRIHHAPAGEIVERRTPQHGLLAAGIHGDIAADAGGVSRGGIDGKDVAGFFSGIGNATGDHAGTGKNGGAFARCAGQLLNHDVP